MNVQLFNDFKKTIESKKSWFLQRILFEEHWDLFNELIENNCNARFVVDQDFAQSESPNENIIAKGQLIKDLDDSSLIIDIDISVCNASWECYGKWFDEQTQRYVSMQEHIL